LIFSFLLVKSCWTTTPIRPEGVAQHGSPSSSQSKQNYKVELVIDAVLLVDKKGGNGDDTLKNI
jgi:hypothetical protein